MTKIENFYKVITSLFLAIILFTFLFIPKILFAEVHITEIMYDLVGADSGREWIEVYNTSDQDVDLSQYRFFRNNVNHRISIYDPNEQGLSNILLAKNYAVIADGPANFLVDHPGFDGILFNSSFSLRDSGEVLSIRNPEGEIDFTVHYLPEWGARGTGNSLQFNGEIWIPALPTPGRENAKIAVNENDESDSASGTSSQNNNSTQSSGGNNLNHSTHSGQNELSFYSNNINLKTGSGRPRYAIINSPIRFEAISNYKSLIIDEENIESRINRPRFHWSFGDSSESRSENPIHYYYSPGEFNIVLNTYYNGEHAINRNTIVVKEPDVDIMLISHGKNSGKNVDVMLKNNSDFEVNFGEFYLKLIYSEDFNHQINTYHLASDTILNSKSELLISSHQTGFIQNEHVNGVALYYPNGILAAFNGFKNDNLKQLFNVISTFVEPAKHQSLIDLLNLIYQ